MKKIIIPIFGVLLLSACKDTYLNPSTASEEQTVNSQSGLIALVNGLQSKFTTTRAGAIYTSISIDGLTTKTLHVLNAGNTEELQFESGGTSLLNSNSIINNLWSQCHLTKANADLIINNIQNAVDPAVKSGILSSAHLFRGLALGTLATFWEKAPIEVKIDAPFVSREDLLKEAIKTLELGATAYASQAPSAAFTGKVSTAINIPNTIQALLARYNLMAGNYDAAIAAANKVDLAIKSGFAFNDVAQNPLFFVSFGNINVTELMANFGLPGGLSTPANDGRRAFYYNGTTGMNPGRASFFTSNSSPIPLYVPGEMSLIKAEALVRKNAALNLAIAELDKVLTKTADAWGIAAAGTGYAGAQTADAVLTEIFKQRQIELLFAGQRLEDCRRFGRAATERTRTWLPYPLFERNNNKVTPPDPAG